MRNRIFLIIAISLLLSATVNAQIYLSPDDFQIKNALDYLYTCQRFDGGFGELGEESDLGLTLRAIMAISSAGENPDNWRKNDNSPIDYLKKFDQDLTAAQAAIFTLALAASKNDPRNFNNANYIEKLKDFYRLDQFGDPKFVFDDAWAILALSNYNGINEIKNSVDFIKGNQNNDSGWSYGVGIETDLDTTALVIMALMAGGEKEDTEYMQNALKLLKEDSNETRKLPYILTHAQNTATLSFIIQALTAAKQDLTLNGDKNLVDTLLLYQFPDGSFTWTWDTSLNPCSMVSYTIPALLLKPYPIVPVEFSTKVREGGEQTILIEYPEEVTVDVRIEGNDKTLWEGPVTVSDSSFVNTNNKSKKIDKPTILGAAIEALKIANMPYEIESAFGDLIVSINNEVGPWSYKINYKSTEICSVIYRLNDWDDILYYHGPFDFKPLRTNVSITSKLRKKLLIKVETFDTRNDKWEPVENATIYISPYQFITDDQGFAKAELEKGGNYSFYAEKPGYVRSKKGNIFMPESTGMILFIVAAIILALIVISVIFIIKYKRENTDFVESS